MSKQPEQQEQTGHFELVEIIRRGYFEIAISGEDLVSITLDTTMLPADIQSLITGATLAVADAKDTEIDSLEMREYAAHQRLMARDNKATLEQFRLGITRRIDAFKDAVMAPFRGPVSDYDAVRQALDQKLIKYEAEEMERRLAAQAEARKKQMEELRRKQAEADRIAEEANQKIDQLRSEAERVALSGGAKQVAEISQQVKTVQEEAMRKVNTIQQEASVLQSQPPAVTAAPLPKTHGFGVVTKWKCRVVDKDAFLRGVLEGRIPKAFVTFDQKALNTQAALLQTDFDYPGCEAYQDKGGVSR